MGGYAGMGNYLKQWRDRNEMTQTAAAKMFGVSQSFIAKIEKGKKNLTVEMFQEIRRTNQSSYGREKDPYQKKNRPAMSDGTI